MKLWQLPEKMPAAWERQYPDIHPVLLQLLYNRGLRDEAAARSFLSGALEDGPTKVIGESGRPSFYDPFLFRDMEKAVALVIGHIKAGDPIVVYGDYDADGVTSSVILLETLKILHAQADVYLPDRVSEGYGLNRPAINQIVSQGYKLLITVDNGIRNKEEVVYAQRKGLEVIITDHHVLPEDRKDMPPCPVIDPADREDGYPWPYLAGVGVAFKLIGALLSKADLPDKQKQLIIDKSLDLAAVGTVADMVNLLGENRLLVKEGLKVLNQRRRFGLNELLKAARIPADRPLEAWNIGWQIGPRLNAASRLGRANTAFSLLTTDDQEEAVELASELNQRNITRQEITEQISSQVEAQIDKENLPKLIAGVAGEGQIWNEGVVGLVAGRIAERYCRPSLVISRLVEAAEFDPETKKLVPKKISFKGSGRSIEGFNLIAAIEDCSEYLDKFGGHPMACGFSVSSPESLELFLKKIQSLAEERIGADLLIPKLKIEAELPFSALDFNLAEDINRLAPFGQNNPQPRFASRGLRIDDLMNMGSDGQHVKMRFSQTGSDGRAQSFWGLAFNAKETYKEFSVGDTVDLAYYLEINAFNGRRDLQLKIIDLKKAEKL